VVVGVRVAFFAGVGLILYSTMLIDHFDLFGLRQVVLAWRRRDYVDHPFKTPGFYRFVRHPLYLGWLVVFWATPHLTAGHALFAGLNTLYLLGAIVLEERDLTARFGKRYRDYQRTTPRLIPRLRVPVMASRTKETPLGGVG
jgi:protein-S-isoprenylcysteine O-methyltransferase Ste14